MIWKIYMLGAGGARQGQYAKQMYLRIPIVCNSIRGMQSISLFDIIPQESFINIQLLYFTYKKRNA